MKPERVAGLLARGCLLALAIVGATLPAVARHRHAARDAAPGVFDYYLLSLSWSPAYCLQSPGAAECRGPRRYGFIVHGLWPQNERGWPENCAAAAGPDDGVVEGMLDIMPARGLILHEWSAHGSCSGLAPADYFALVRRVYQSVVLPAALADQPASLEQAPSAVADAFARANPRLPAQAVVVTCTGQGAPRLREVHVCFDRSLAPRACSSDALRATCRAPTLIVPPIR